jgi:hypothetical protein
MPNSPLFRTLIDSGSLLEGTDTLVLTGIATDVIATGAALARRLGVLPTPAWEREPGNSVVGYVAGSYRAGHGGCGHPRLLLPRPRNVTGWLPLSPEGLHGAARFLADGQYRNPGGDPAHFTTSSPPGLSVYPERPGGE